MYLNLYHRVIKKSPTVNYKGYVQIQIEFQREIY